MKLPSLLAPYKWRLLGLIGLSAAIGLFLLVRCSDRAQDKAITTATEKGRAEEQAAALTETLNRTLEAANADEKQRRDAVARHDLCVQHARNPEDC